ncbi:MAG: hypothetical protein HKN43_16810 [Rhodothermales bacterium]|nr:hypothetical protein [Rhodothermales bacterium]
MEGYELRPLTVADIFDRTFSLVGGSLKQILGLGAVIVVPAAIASWLLFSGFFSFLGDFILTLEETDVPDAAILAELFKAMGGVSIAIVILFAAETLFDVGLVLTYCGKTIGKNYETRELIGLTFSSRGARAVLQKILAEIGCILAMAIPYFIFILSIGADAGAIAILFGTLIFFAGIFLVLYLRVRWAFGLTAIGWEETGVLEAFGRSSSLVHGQTVRTFLLFALFSLITSFAVTLIMTPVQFFVLWDFFLSYLSLVSELGAGEPDVSGVIESLTSFGPGFALLIGLSMLLTSGIKTAYQTSFYFDLRARQGEFDPGISQPESDG